MQRALSLAVPTIWNHDQGSHFTSLTYTALLRGKGVQIPRDHHGQAFDNIFTVRLWRSVNYEEVYLHDNLAPREARPGVDRYFQLYNDDRPHEALGYRTPAEQYHSRGTAGGTLLTQDPKPNAPRRTQAERPAPADADVPPE